MTCELALAWLQAPLLKFDFSLPLYMRFIFQVPPWYKAAAEHHHCPPLTRSRGRKECPHDKKKGFPFRDRSQNLHPMLLHNSKQDASHMALPSCQAERITALHKLRSWRWFQEIDSYRHGPCAGLSETQRGCTVSMWPQSG